MILYTCATKHFQNKYLTTKTSWVLLQKTTMKQLFYTVLVIEYFTPKQLLFGIEATFVDKHDPITEKKIVHVHT